MKPLTVGKTVRDAAGALSGDEAQLEAEVLLMHALGIDRAQLYLRLDQKISGDESAAFAALLARRRAHEPLAYITGHREFFGLDFEVTPAVLIPRPETETLVEAAISFANERFPGESLTIADIGTGSGIIAVSLAVSLPAARIIATDISADALPFARGNAERHYVSDRIEFRQGDLLVPLDSQVHVIVGNPPYVTTTQLEMSPPEIRDHEPRIALDGGVDGLDVIRRLLTEAPARLTRGGALFCEIGDWQGKDVKRLARESFPGTRIEVLRDLAGRDRVLAVYA